MERNFDSVSATKDKDSYGILKLGQKDIKSSNSGHTATAKKINGNLKITADLEGKKYGYQMDDVDIQEEIKCQVKDKYVEVTVTKNSKFKLQDKI